jgi:hypothetical protein
MLESLQNIDKTLNKLDKWMGSKKKAPPQSEPIWSPLPGPQTMAFTSLSDEVLYGGAAGVLGIFYCLYLSIFVTSK